MVFFLVVLLGLSKILGMGYQPNSLCFCKYLSPPSSPPQRFHCFSFERTHLLKVRNISIILNINLKFWTMLPKNESGEKITIEDVFHSLNRRLNAIWMGINSHGNLYTGYEFGYRISDSIDEITNYVDGFPAIIALNATLYPLSIIEKIREKIEANLDLPMISKSDDSWPISTVNNFIQIKEELAEYELFLKQFQDVLLMRIDLDGNSSFCNDKIKINITVEQLGALIYFLNNTKEFQKNEKVFNAELISICRVLSTILCSSNGDPISAESIKNNSSYFKKNEKCIAFWKEKFISYMNQSILLMGNVNR